MTNLLIISLHASPNMAPGVSEWGGTHTYMKELLQEIDYTKFCVILITRKVYNVQNDVETINENCKIVNLNFGASGDFDKKLISGFHNSNLKTVKQILKTLNFIPDIIHSVYWNSGFLAYELSKYYKINYVHITAMLPTLKRTLVLPKDSAPMRCKGPYLMCSITI